MKNILFLIVISSALFSQSLFSQDITFQPTSETLEGLTEVKRLIELGAIMDAVISVAVFSTLFDPSQKVIEQVFSINTTDWTVLVKAFNSTNQIARNSVRKHCDQMMWEHSKMSSKLPDVRKRIRDNQNFWKEFRASIP